MVRAYVIEDHVALLLDRGDLGRQRVHALLLLLQLDLHINMQQQPSP